MTRTVNIQSWKTNSSLGKKSSQMKRKIYSIPTKLLDNYYKEGEEKQQNLLGDLNKNFGSILLGIETHSRFIDGFDDTTNSRWERRNIDN